MPLTLKKGVVITSLCDEMVYALWRFVSVFDGHGLECIVTSGADSTHKPGSLHYKGRALDFRTKHIPAEQRKLVLRDLQEELGEDFDVLLEGVGKPNEHLHVEYDPKG